MLPKEYQEVEYLETDGAQYIDTGIIPENGFGFFVDWMPLTNVDRTSASSKLMGSSKRNDGFWGGIEISTYAAASGGQMTWFDGDIRSNSRKWYDPGFESYTRIQLSNINNHYHSSTGKDYQTLYITASEVYGTLYLLSIHSNAGLSGAGSRLWLCKLYNNDDIVANLIPCYRKADEKPGMYDTVRKIFLMNQGTGEFICGPAVYNALLRETNGLEMGHRRELLAWQMYKKSKGPIYKINPPIGTTDTEHAFFADGDRDLTVLLAHKSPNISSPKSSPGHGSAAVLYDTTINNYYSFMGITLYSGNGYPYIICGFAEDGNYAYNAHSSYDAKLYAPYPTRLIWRHKKGTKTATLKHQNVDSEGTFNVTSRERKDFYPCTTTLKISSTTKCVVTEVLIYDRILTDAEEKMYIRNGIAP